MSNPPPESTENTAYDWALLIAQLVALIREIPLRAEILDESAPRLAATAASSVSHQLATSSTRSGSVSAAALADTIQEILRDLSRAVCGDAAAVEAVVAQRIRDLAFTEAHRGVPLETLRQAGDAAVIHLWRLAHRTATRDDWSPHLLGALGTTVMSLSSPIDQFLFEGHRLSFQCTPEEPAALRTQLLWALLAVDQDDEHPLAEVESRAAAAGWQVPPEIAVIRTRRPVAAATLPAEALLDRTATPARVLVDAAVAGSAAEALLTPNVGGAIAVSPAVAPTGAALGDRLARRALLLSETGVLPATGVVHCDEHAMTLWLHAEPEIRSRLIQELLAPLLAESPTSRMVLAETMLAWLNSRDSAPMIAQKLGVHPQTVRYRWRRLNDLFGDQLRDPEFINTATLVLRAVVPLWRAGHAPHPS